MSDQQPGYLQQLLQDEEFLERARKAGEAARGKPYEEGDTWFSLSLGDNDEFIHTPDESEMEWVREKIAEAIAYDNPREAGLKDRLALKVDEVLNFVDKQAIRAAPHLAMPIPNHPGGYMGSQGVAEHNQRRLQGNIDQRKEREQGRSDRRHREQVREIRSGPAEKRAHGFWEGINPFNR